MSTPLLPKFGGQCQCLIVSCLHCETTSTVAAKLTLQLLDCLATVSFAEVLHFTLLSHLSRSFCCQQNLREACPPSYPSGYSRPTCLGSDGTGM